MNVHLFVEGGGNQKRTKTACRKAFHIFIGRVLDERPKPRIVSSGSREEAYRDFCRLVANDSDTLAMLLLDSEDPVPAGRSPIAHLRGRDKWTDHLSDGRVHLMVQCMEAWFLADKAALADYYGNGFNESALPKNPAIEDVPKKDIMGGLDRATAKTAKRVLSQDAAWIRDSRTN